MPEDDGISDDEFDGYLDADDDVGLDGADPRDADHGVSGSPIPDHLVVQRICQEPLHCNFFSKWCQTKCLITLLGRQTSMPNNTWRALTFLQTPELMVGATPHSIGPS